MRKIKLHLDSLAVESFETGEDGLARGTVQGQGVSNARCDSEISCDYTCYFLTCNISDCDRCTDTWDAASCDIYCTGTCGTSCNEPCPSCMPEYC